MAVKGKEIAGKASTTSSKGKKLATKTTVNKATTACSSSSNDRKRKRSGVLQFFEVAADVNDDDEEEEDNDNLFSGLTQSDFMSRRRTSLKDSAPLPSSLEEEVRSEEEEVPSEEAAEEQGEGDLESVELTPQNPNVPASRKRPGGNRVDKDSKKKLNVEGNDAGTSSKTSPFARKFDEHDDIVILEGLRDWKREKSDDHDPQDAANVPEFLENIQESLHYTVKSVQMMRSKMNRLQRKYRGFNSVPSNPHDLKCYELMKVIWGEEVDRNNTKSAPVLRKSTRSRSKAETCHVSAVQNSVPSTSKKGHKETSSTSKKVHKDIPSTSLKVHKANLSAYPLLDAVSKDAKNFEILGEVFRKNGLAFLGDSKAMKFEKKLRKLHASKANLDLRYKKLVRKLMTSLLRASSKRS